MQAMVASLVALLVAGPVAAQSGGAGQPGGTPAERESSARASTW